MVGAYDDGDKNIYVVGADGKRTRETIGTTMQPTDFMGTDDKTGGFSGYVSTTFRLDKLTGTGSVKPNEHTATKIYNADAQKLLDWGMQLFREVERQSPFTFIAS